MHAHVCPGCPWMGRDEAAQLADKAEHVSRAMAGFAELAALSVAAVRAAPRSLDYRVRAKLVADERGALGLFARGTHDVVDLPGCRVLDPRVAAAAQALRKAIHGKPWLEGADIARVDDALMVTLIARPGACDETLATLAEGLRAACPDIASIAVSRRAHGAVQLLGGAVEPLSGPSELRRHLHADGPYHYATFGAFVQAHPDVARAIYDEIVARVFAAAGSVATAGSPAAAQPPRRGPRVLELHAGSGALSLALAARGAEVVAVEGFGPACERLERAAREQKLAVTVRHGDAGEEALALARAGQRFDVVLVNPPRRGLDVDVRRAVAELAPAHAAYVSCHPPTLARDLAQLAQEGLATELLAPFDMMPLTEHVETLAWLSRAAEPAARILFEHDDFVAVLKAPHEPTTPQGEHARSLQQRVRALPGLAEAVPVHRLDVGTSGVCLFARRPELVQGVAEALATGDKYYVALAHGVVRPQGTIRRPIHEQGQRLEASTRYRRSAVIAGHSLVRVALDTGRKHQIRRHFVAIGHPLVGDGRYGDRRTNLHFSMRHGLDRPFLHCETIALSYRDARLEISAPLARDLSLVLDSLRLDDRRPSRDDGRPRAARSR
jgi:23S rRNA (uracil1939-C5)-methyltransferase